MSNLNKVILVGRVDSEIELKYTTEGSALAKFTLNVERPKRPDGIQSSDIVSVVAWSKLAEICAEYLKNGRLILIEGRIQVRSYDDNNGKRKYSTEVIAQTMKMLEGLSAKQETQSFSPESVSVKAPVLASVKAVPAEPTPQAIVADQASESESQFAEVSESFYTEDDIPF